MTIGQRISTIRKKKRISQKDLAKQSDLTVSGLQKIEYGEINPREETIHKIAKALGVDDIELDDDLKERVIKWNSQIDVDSIQKEAEVFGSLPNYDMDDIETFRQFLSLNPDRKEQATEFIEFLMQKQEK